MFFTTDHGDYAGNRGLLRKMPTFPFDDLARVPFFVSGASVAGGHRVDQVVQSCDFALTCLDLAGVAPPEDTLFDTQSLRPLLQDRAAVLDRERPVFSATSSPTAMVRRGAYKLIRHASRNEEVLFDLATDPGETIDLARAPEYRSQRDDLDATLREMLDRPVVRA